MLGLTSRAYFAVLALLVVAPTLKAQQQSDTVFTPVVEKAQYKKGLGPRVLIDSAHLNFHTAEGGYAAFAALAGLDGHRVDSNRELFTAKALARADILVIANAMHKQSEADWAPLPNHSAFTQSEIEQVEAWVRGGGSLLLIADHMPLAGHAERLASAFGIRFHNGFALDTKGSGQVTFRRFDGSLRSSSVTNGRGTVERINSVTTFTGQAFRLDPTVKGEPLLVLSDEYSLLLPEIAFRFSDRTPRISAAHLLQGAIVYHGKGRVAVFGEAAMFTAQVAGSERRPIGMNAPEATENQQFALNVLHWLSGVL